MKNIFESEKLLAHAFKALFDFVVSMDATGAKDEEAPAFSYILFLSIPQKIKVGCKRLI
ncbi:hypothetical protein ABFU52_10990 [Xanthomonas campestris pv. campestris]|uniref:hypothetical protein n=1 Tax=Xanthomonas campestris TaxID=339 RepID=UPI00388FCCEC